MPSINQALERQVLFPENNFQAVGTYIVDDSRWLKRKVYVSHTEENGWDFKAFNRIQILLRKACLLLRKTGYFNWLNCYHDTHLEHIASQMERDPSIPDDLRSRIHHLWRRTYPDRPSPITLPQGNILPEPELPAPLPEPVQVLSTEQQTALAEFSKEFHFLYTLEDLHNPLITAQKIKRFIRQGILGIAAGTLIYQAAQMTGIATFGHEFLGHAVLGVMPLYRERNITIQIDGFQNTAALIQQPSWQSVIDFFSKRDVHNDFARGRLSYSAESPSPVGNLISEYTRNSWVSLSGSLPDLLFNTYALNKGITLTTKNRPFIGLLMATYACLRHLQCQNYPLDASISGCDNAGEDHDFCSFATNMSQITTWNTYHILVITTLAYGWSPILSTMMKQGQRVYNKIQEWQNQTIKRKAFIHWLQKEQYAAERTRLLTQFLSHYERKDQVIEAMSSISQLVQLAHPLQRPYNDDERQHAAEIGSFMKHVMIQAQRQNLLQEENALEQQNYDEMKALFKAPFTKIYTIISTVTKTAFVSMSFLCKDNAPIAFQATAAISSFYSLKNVYQCFTRPTTNKQKLASLALLTANTAWTALMIA